MMFMLFTAFISISAVWILIIPPLQTPDEQAHLRYIEFVAKNKRLPNSSDIEQGDIERSVEIEALMEDTQADRVFHNRGYHFDYENPQRTDVNQVNFLHLMRHPPLYYIWGALIYLATSSFGIAAVLYSIRFGNLIFAGMNFIFAYKTAKLILPQKGWFSNLLPIVICFWPQFMFINSGINNDVFLFTSFFAAFYYVLKIYKSDDLNKKDLLKISSWGAIGVLSKVQFFAFLPVIGVVLLKKMHKQLLSRQIIYFVLPFIFPLVYYSRNLIEFGSVFAKGDGRTGIISDWIAGPSVSHSGESIFQYIKILISPRLVLVYKSFVGNFGWLDTQLPQGVYIVLGIIIVFSVLGLLKYLYTSKQKLKSFLIPEVIIFGAVSILLEGFYIYLYLGSYIRHGNTGFPTQGRYYFPLMIPIFTMVIFGISKLIPKQFLIHFSKTVIVLMFFFNVFCIGVLLLRYYL